MFRHLEVPHASRGFCVSPTAEFPAPPQLAMSSWQRKRRFLGEAFSGLSWGGSHLALLCYHLALASQGHLLPDSSQFPPHHSVCSVSLTALEAL